MRFWSLVALESIMAKLKAMTESAETPQMEAKSHSTKFLKSAVKAKSDMTVDGVSNKGVRLTATRNKLSPAAASKIRAKASKIMGKGY